MIQRMSKKANQRRKSSKTKAAKDEEPTGNSETVESPDSAAANQPEADTKEVADTGPSSNEETAEIDGVSIEAVVEALLFATDTPLTPSRIAQILGIGTSGDAKKTIHSLNERYESINSAFRVEEIAGGFQMFTLPNFNPWLSKLLRSRTDSRLSQAALETLAIVAYRQPVMRADVEAIRGVAVGDMLARLREMKLIKIVGRAEEVGRPLLYGTTKRFLEVFGLANVKDLPKVEDMPAPVPTLKVVDTPEADRDDEPDRPTKIT